MNQFQKNEKSRRVSRPRPGHADLVGGMKYGHNDMRNVLERSSARETTVRVAAGAVAKNYCTNLALKLPAMYLKLAERVRI